MPSRTETRKVGGGDPAGGALTPRRAGSGGRARRIGSSWALLLSLGLAACAAGPGPVSPGAAGDPCMVVPPPATALSGGTAAAGAPADPGTVVVIGLTGPVDPAHAPVPRNAAERLVFANLYETLVRVTCDGRVEPWLAASWQVLDDGRRWTFTLRDQLRDWEGAPISAERVAAGWRAAREAGMPGLPGADAVPAIASLTVVDARTLRVALAEPVTEAFFARPELAVAMPAGAGAAWPKGSGPLRPREDDLARPRRGRLPSLVHGDGGPRIELRALGADARNALDQGVDLLVTTDRAVIDYAAATSFRTVPLPWDRAYVLVSPGAAVRAAEVEMLTAPAAGRVGGRGVPVGLRDREPYVRVLRAPESALWALAHQAVPVDARAAPATRGSGACLAPARDPAPDGGGAAMEPSGVAAAEPRNRRVVYAAGDIVGRALAERLVALSLDDQRPEARWIAETVPVLQSGRARVAGLPPNAFAEALRSGGDAAYVVPVAGVAGDECVTAAALLAQAPWLAAEAPAQASLAPGVVPLVETRSTLVVRQAIGGVAIDGAGTLLLRGLRVAPRPGDSAEGGS